MKISEMWRNRHNGKCPFCGKPASEMTFKDETSLKEFSISGLCQECQDEIF